MKYLLLITLLLFTACDNDDGDDKDEEKLPRGNATFKIGTETITSARARYVPSVDDNTFLIILTEFDTASTMGIYKFDFFGLSNGTNAVGTYTVDFKNISDWGDNYGILKTNDTGNWVSILGNFKITEHTKDIMKGTFSFTILERYGTNQKSVSNGSFTIYEYLNEE